MGPPTCGKPLSIIKNNHCPPVDDAFSPVVDFDTIFLLLFIADHNNLSGCMVDVECTYLQANTKERISTQKDLSGLHMTRGQLWIFTPHSSGHFLNFCAMMFLPIGCFGEISASGQSIIQNCDFYFQLLHNKRLALVQAQLSSQIATRILQYTCHFFIQVHW